MNLTSDEVLRRGLYLEISFTRQTLLIGSIDPEYADLFHGGISEMSATRSGAR